MPIKPMEGAPEDIAGVPLAAAFSAEIVEPLLTQSFPELCECPSLSA